MKICLYCDSECNDSDIVCSACGGREFGKKCPRCGKVYSGESCPDCAAAEKKADDTDKNTNKNTTEKKKIGSRERNLIIVVAIAVALMTVYCVSVHIQLKKEAQHDEYVSSVLAETTTNAPSENIRNDADCYYDGGYLCVEDSDPLTTSECKTLNNALKSYYEKTGVGVYFLITYETGYSDEAAMNSLYDSLFNDETHLLIVYALTDDGADWNSLRGTDVYNLVEEGSYSALADLLNETYDSPLDFVNAIAGFFGDTQ